MDAFDADVLIYAAAPRHPQGRRILNLVRRGRDSNIGSVLLLPELLGKPLREGRTTEVRRLAGLLARLDLRPVDRTTAELATVLSSRYRLRATDAAHLATAISAGADRFLTNNRRDFRISILEIQVTYPEDLP